MELQHLSPVSLAALLLLFFARRLIAREWTLATRHRQNTPSSIANRNAASFRRSAETIIAPEDGPDRAGCTADRKPVRFAT
jgi:hypothetical protein